MKNKKLDNVLAATFNAANLGGLGAISMSLGGMGSKKGAAAFLLAIVLGTFNKYRSLTRDRLATAGEAKPGFFRRLKESPSFTAIILMTVAGGSGMAALWDTLTQGREERFRNICRTACWLFGVLGDDAVRRLDKVNFRNIAVAGQKAKSAFRASFEAASANPALFYSASCVAAAGGVFRPGEASTLQNIFSLAVIGLHVTGIAHALGKFWLGARGKIAPEKINGGLVNYTTSGGLVLQSIFAFVSGKPWIGAGQGIFAIASRQSLPETWAALKKNSDSPAPP